MTTICLFAGEISNDYHQIYLRDARQPDLPDDYSDETIARRVMVAPGAIIIHIEREMPVPVRVELHQQRPAIDLARCDHAVETALTAASGRLVLAGLLAYVPEASQFEVSAGTFGVLVTFEALDSLSSDGLEGDDRYAIHLWPDREARAEVVVLKARSR